MARLITVAFLVGCISSVSAIYKSDSNNHITSPVTTGGPLSTESDPVWQVGDKHTISWVTNVTSPYWLSLWQHDPVQASARNLTVLWSTDSAVGSQSFDWIVEVPSNADLSFSPLFLVWISGPEVTFASWTFNITDRASVSSSTSSSLITSASSSTAPTSMISSTATTSTITSATPSIITATGANSNTASTLTMAQTPSAALATTAADVSGAPTSDNGSTKVGLGVGLGIGVPLVLIVGTALAIAVLRELSKRKTLDTQPAELSAYTREEKGHYQGVLTAAASPYKFKLQPDAIVRELPANEHFELPADRINHGRS